MRRILHESMLPDATDLTKINLKPAITRNPLVVSPDTTLMSAIAQMASANSCQSTPQTADEPLNLFYFRARSSCVVVVEGGKVVGILTESDVVRLSAQHQTFAQTASPTGSPLTVRQVMTYPVITLREADFTDVFLAADLLQQHHIQHLPIVDAQDHLVGLVTQESLWHTLNPLTLYRWTETLDEKVVHLEAEKGRLLENRTAELERQVAARTIALKAKSERERVLVELSTQIRSSLSLQKILDTTVEQVRTVLGCDRVNIWRFEADWQSFVVAESTDSLPSLVGEQIDSTWLKHGHIAIFRCGWVRMVPDIRKAEISKSHREMLIRLQTRSKLLVPLLCGNTLWGLLNATESQYAREWQPEEVELLQALSGQLAIALQQATTHQQLQAELNERRQAEALLQESEQRYVSLVAAVPVGILRTDTAGNCVYVNDRWCQMSGFTPTATLGMGWQHNIHPEDRERVVARWRQSVEENCPCQLECRLQHPSGEIVWVHVQFVAERDGEGQVIGYVGTITDIKDRKQTEQQLQQLNKYLETKIEERTAALQEREARYRALIEVIPDLMIRIHADGTILDVVMGGGVKLFNQSKTGIGRQIYDSFPLEQAQQRMFYVQRALQTREFQIYEYRLMIDEELRAEEARIVAINNEEVLVIVRDITDRKQAEIQLQQTNEALARATRLKDEFLANMSHELRTPLNAILGMAEGLQEEIFGGLNERQLKALETIESSGTHLLALINDILDVAKIESGQIQLHYAATTVASLCESSLAFITQQALKKGIQIETRIPANLPDLLVDERRIRQVLINLLTNAVKFTPEGGHVTLAVIRPQPVMTLDARNAAIESCLESISGELEHDQIDHHVKTWTDDRIQRHGSRESCYLRIAVMDTGIGIAPENIEKLFQPFIQIDSALNRKYDGTGLGLALVKRIVELHGGQVGVTSEVGVGSCFTVDLPYVNPLPLGSQSGITSGYSLEASQLEQSTSPLILLAEDNQANIATVSSYLRAKGYRLLLAQNGQEAIALAKSECPDLILMDIQMPEMDGLEAMQRIRCSPTLMRIPIIALTALAMTGDRERCLAAGATDYLSKPVPLKRLAMMIEKLLVPLKQEIPHF